MIFQELLNTCDPRRIAEIWNNNRPQDEEALDVGAVANVVQKFCEMLRGLTPEQSEYALLALENYADGKGKVETEMVKSSELREKLAQIQNKKTPEISGESSNEQIKDFLTKTKDLLPQAFAYDYTPWEETLGVEVYPENYMHMGKDVFLASALYEMSFNGMTREKQEKQRKKLTDAIEEYKKIEKMPPEEREKHLYTWEDIMDEFDFKDDRSEEEKEAEERQNLLDSIKTRLAWITELQNMAGNADMK